MSAKAAGSASQMLSTSATNCSNNIDVILPMAYDKNAPMTVSTRPKWAVDEKRIWSHGEDVRLAAGDENGVAGAVGANRQHHAGLEDVVGPEHLVAEADAVDVGTELGPRYSSPTSGDGLVRGVRRRAREVGLPSIAENADGHRDSIAVTIDPRLEGCRRDSV